MTHPVTAVQPAPLTQTLAVLAAGAADTPFQADVWTAEGWQVLRFSGVEELGQRLAGPHGERPAVVMLVPAPQDGLDDQVTRLRALGVGGAGATPLWLLSRDDSLPARLQALRAGVDLYVHAPVQPAEAQALLANVRHHRQDVAYRVLVVDDDALMVELHGSMLQAAGFEVRTLTRPLELLALVDSFEPDVLVLDVYMPGVSGPELAAILHARALQRGRDLPVLFLSPETDEQVQMQALQAGGDDFLLKPVSASHLVAAVTMRARRARRNNQVQRQLGYAVRALEREHLALDQHAIVSITDVHGEIIYVNDRFCAISGYTRDELIGQNHRVVKSAEHAASVYRGLWDTISAGRIWQGELCNRRKDGTLYWVESTIVPLLDEAGLPYQYVSIRTDITRVKQDESVFRTLVERTAKVRGDDFFQAAVDGLADALGMRMAFISVRDPGDAAFCRTVALWDRGAPAENFSYPLAGSPCENVLQHGVSVYASGVARQFPDDRWLADNGFESYVGVPLLDSGGGLLGHMGLLDERALADGGRIVTYLQLFAQRVAAELERRRYDQQLEAHKERLRRGQFFANIGTWEWNIASGELFWTERIAPLFGYPEGELETSYENFLRAVHPDDRQAVIDAVNACVERDVPYEIEHRVVWPDGSVRWLLERGAVVRDAQGQPLQMLGVVQDIDDRKRAEAALQESRLLLEEAQALAQVGSWRLDVATNEVFWSRELYRMYGFDPGQPPPAFTEHQRLFTPDSWALLNAALTRTVQEGVPYTLELEMVRPDGRPGWMWVRGEQVRDGHGRVVALRGMAQDITERKRVELALARREQELLQAQALAHIGSWSADLQTGELHWSDEIYRIFGHLPGSFQPSVQVFHDAVHPEDRARMQESERRAEQTGLLDVVHRIVRPDGTVRHVRELARTELNARGEAIGYSGTVQDVTEQLEAEQRLRRTEERFAFAVEGAGDGVWDWNLVTGDMPLSANYEPMLGYAPGELPPTIEGWIQSVHPEDLARVQGELTDYFEGRADGYAPELRLRCKDGSYKWILCRGTVVERAADGRPTRMIGIHSDITTRKQAEAALVEARETAERANQAKSEFLSSMSHELRTPMNAILGFGQLLDYDESLSEDNRDNVREILKAGQHLLELINEVLDLAKVESGHIDLSIEPVQLHPVVQECMSLLSTQAAQRRLTLYNACPDTLMVRADRIRLKQVLLNLLSNAVKYNRPGGHVRVQVQAVAADRLRIGVEDTGNGIPPQRLPELFQPFSRLGAENSGIEGTGIGLNITRRLVEMMGGEVGVHSEVGEGSTFWCELPLEGEGPAPEEGGLTDSAAAGAVAPPAQAVHPVLYIEDNPANIRLVAQILGRRPHVQLLTAHTAELGLELAMARRPHLILLDINLPHMDGYQVLSVLRASAGLEGVPVVAITANAMPRDVARGMAAGFDDYLAKPLDVVAFMATVDRLLMRRRPVEQK